MYKSETILGLVGSILAAVFAFVWLAGSVLVTVFVDYFEPFLAERLEGVVDFFRFPYGSFFDFASGVIVIIAAVSFLVAAASVVLGFIGTAQLRRDQKSGGVMLIVGAALSFISIIGFIPFVLMLVGGIMALSKKPAETAAPVQNIQQ